MQLLYSNRLELLFDALVEQLCATVPQDPLMPQTILVPGKAVADWLQLHLTRHFGIWANPDFPFPATLLSSVNRQAPKAARDPWTQDLLALRILRLLEEAGGETSFREIVPEDPLQRFQFSLKLAELFDLYGVYRPEMLFAWEQKSHDSNNWQATLWRRLIRERPETPPVRQWADFIRACVKGQAPALPFSALQVFGVSGLAPSQIDLLAALDRVLPVHLFLLNPCREYWFDLAPHPLLADAQARHYETGHPLLAAWGKAGGDLFMLLWEQIPALSENALFDDPGNNSLLHMLQSDILNLFDRTNTDEEEKSSPPAGADASLQIHSCFTQQREMEALHDFLVGCLQELENLHCADILVLVPDLKSYAPYIMAVFGTRKPAIPFTLADLEEEAPLPLPELLALRHGRYEVSQVLDLLKSPAVASRLALSPTDLERLSLLVQESAIRWGIDAADRKGRDLPAFGENSWRAGLDRLFLGYAFPPGSAPFANLQPCERLTADDARLLGVLAGFMELLDRFLKDLSIARSGAAWRDLLLEALPRFFPDDDEQWATSYNRLENLVLEWAQITEEAHFEEPLGIDQLELWLARRLGETGTTAGRIGSGRVTFAEPGPASCLPFRVIAMPGLANGKFPRSTAAASFDEMARNPRRGDRQPRRDDRLHFLEGILSARDRLYLSYVGQNIRDNSFLEPSVLISELMDYLDRGFRCPRYTECPRFDANRCGSWCHCEENGLFFRHKMHAFHPAYFTRETTLTSFSQTDFAAARAYIEHSQPLPFPAPLAEPDNASKTLRLKDLWRFFLNPGEYFVRQRLGIFLDPPEKNPISDEEPFSLSPRERSILGDRLVETRLENRAPEEIYAHERGADRLPPGKMGKILFENLETVLDPFGASIEERIAGATPRRETFAVQIGDFQITDIECLLAGDSALHYHFARPNSTHVLRYWLTRLALDCHPQKPAAAGSRIFLRGEKGKDVLHKRLIPVADAQEQLAGLLELYWQGLRSPLALLPALSCDYLKSLLPEPKGLDIHSRADILCLVEQASPQMRREAWENACAQWNEIRAQDDALRFLFPESYQLPEKELHEQSSALWAGCFSALRDENGNLSFL